MNAVDTLLEFVRKHGLVTNHEIANALGIGQTSVARLLAEAGAGVMRIGAARATRYAATREVRGLGRQWPIHRVDRRGQLQHIAQIHALHDDRWLVRPETDWASLLLIGSDRGLFDGLPWYLDALRPQGFMGRIYAQQCSRLLGRLPADPNAWGDDDTLVGAIIAGDDVSGSFMLGEAPAERFRAHRIVQTPIKANDLAETYGQAASAALAGEQPGSSAAGEQPKFGALRANADNSVRHVLVKFSPPSHTEAGRRWGDLLVCEHLANACLGGLGIDVAATQIVRAAERVFLQSTRFDRVGEFGRIALTSLSPLATSLGCASTRWSDAGALLHEQGLITEATLQRMISLQQFGMLIGNTDMHLGNLSLWVEDGMPFTLAPLYDMLPMLYRPTSQGEVVERTFKPAVDGMPDWIVAAAGQFWRSVAESGDISEPFRDLARGHAGHFAGA
jgi:hypothetical protein